jgi:hypothetical protein
VNQCQSTTSKKAWRNPLAPYARCSRDSKMLLEKKGVAWGTPQRACTIHGKKLLEQGWTEVKP